MAEKIPHCDLCGILMDKNPSLAIYEVAPHPDHPGRCIHCVKHWPHLIGQKAPAVYAHPLAPSITKKEKEEQKNKEAMSILSLLGIGLAYEQISQRLGICVVTIPKKLKAAGQRWGGELVSVRTGYKAQITDFGKQILEKGV